jgi:hypothetical protein
MTSTSRRDQVRDLLRNRVCNRDGVGVLLARLRQALLLLYHRWWQHEHGGRGGPRLVEAAPTVSAYLDRVAFEVRPGRGRPISNAVETFFALGLLAAAHACELLGADRFSSEVSVQDLLQALCEIDIGGENDPFPPPGEFDCLGELTRELIKLEPRLKYMLVACVKLARLEAQDDDTGGFLESGGFDLTFVFVVGAAGAGVLFDEAKHWKSGVEGVTDCPPDQLHLPLMYEPPTEEEDDDAEAGPFGFWIENSLRSVLDIVADSVANGSIESAHKQLRLLSKYLESSGIAEPYRGEFQRRIAALLKAIEDQKEGE